MISGSMRPSPRGSAFVCGPVDHTPELTGEKSGSGDDMTPHPRVIARTLSRRERDGARGLLAGKASLPTFSDAVCGGRLGVTPDIRHNAVRIECPFAPYRTLRFRDSCVPR